MKKTYQIYYWIIGIIILIIMFMIFLFSKRYEQYMDTICYNINDCQDICNPYIIQYDFANEGLKEMKPDGDNRFWSFSPGISIDHFENGDPTHGTVIYGNNDDLISIENNQLKINIQEQITGLGEVRKSVRIHTNTLFDHGLFIIDVEHIPVGPGVWPAFWLNGNVTGNIKWACNGEIDIIEGITKKDGSSTSNYSTLHTNGPSCIQDIPNITHQDCSAGDGPSQDGCGCNGTEKCPNLGCGIYWKDPKTFGTEFNKNKGGVYACELTDTGGITIWFWERDDPDYPKDRIENSKSLNPKTWKAKNKVQYKECKNNFKQMTLIINTTICGDWAGNVFDGTSESLAHCQGFVTDPNTNDFYKGSYWLINFVKIYQKR